MRDVAIDLLTIVGVVAFFMVLASCSILENVGKPPPPACDMPPPRIQLGDTPNIQPRHLAGTYLIAADVLERITDEGAEPLATWLEAEEGSHLVVMTIQEWSAMLDADQRLAFAYGQQGDYIANVRQCQKEAREAAE